MRGPKLGVDAGDAIFVSSSVLYLKIALGTIRNDGGYQIEYSYITSR